MRAMNPVAQTFSYLALFLAGAMVYVLIGPLILGVPLLDLLLSAGGAIYDWVGIVALGLVPQSAYLLFAASRTVSQGLRTKQWVYPPQKALDFVIETAPMLGMLGTMIALMQAMGSIDITHGIQGAIREMTYRVGQALGSSILGLILALFAFVLKWLGKGEPE